MPGGDGTGPWGAGRWFCRRRFWGCRRQGRGFGPGQPSMGGDAAGLKSYAEALASELEDVRKRIAEMEK